MRKKRVVAPLPQVEIKDDTDTLLGLIRDEEGKKMGEVVPEPDTDYSPPLPVQIPSGAVDDYLKRQVNQELYGTEEPSNYERTLLTLRNRL